MSKECSDPDINQKDKPLRTDLEITAASEKLAECQETVHNLGKQLRSLAAPKDASLFDNVIAAQLTNTNTSSATTTTASKMNPSPAPPKVMKAKNRSLLDQMLSEDDT
ncbi:filament-like plant protein 7-like, partial [Trifolium medium]|nr:filament-like plant protein 7-like [Trifolium medium]